MAHFSLSLKLSAIVDPAVADVLTDPDAVIPADVTLNPGTALRQSPSLSYKSCSVVL